MDIIIEPTTLSFSIVKLTYDITRLVPNDHCYINVYLTESGGNRLKRYELMLAGNDYAQWGQDDAYLTDWICIQCGVRQPYVEPSPIVEPIVEPSPTVEPTVEPIVEPIIEPSPTVEPIVEPTPM